MPVFPPQQPSSDWDSNIYVVTVTRILVVIGVTYLIRSVYQYITRLRLPNDGNRIAVTTPVSGADLNLRSLALGDPSELTLNIDFDETLNPPAPIAPTSTSTTTQTPRAKGPLATTRCETVNVESGGGH